MAQAQPDADSQPGTRVRLTRPRLHQLLASVAERLHRPARLFLVGESALVAAGLQEWTGRLVYAVDAGASSDIDPAVRGAVAMQGVAAERECPADVLPLPAGHERRARALDGMAFPGTASNPVLEVLCFDPVSVAIRLVARGDEPDYRAVLAFLRHGWLTMDDLERALAEVLPRFSVESIQQDPAEFRRKFKGLQQMWRALAAAAARRLP